MWKHIRNIALLLLVLIGAVIFWFMRGQTAELPLAATTGPSPELTEISKEYFPTINIAKAASWPKDAAPKAAAGYAVARFAEGLDHPRSMYLLPNGDVLVAETNSPPRTNKGVEGFVMRNLMGQAGAGTVSANRISLLRDGDGDGKAEQKFAFLEGLNSPFGMALVGDKFYVANTDGVLEFAYESGATKITGKSRRVANLNAKAPNNHWTRGLLASPDGKYLYVSVGSNSNIGEHGMDTENQRAAILRIELASNARTIYAAGLRNPVGMDWNPVNGELWTVVNERDMLGGDLVPDYLTEVEEGTHFGWPWHYWGGYVDPRVEPKNLDHRQYERRPDYALGAHVAPLGFMFVPQKNLLGPDWAGDVVVARHGSWNRKPRSGYDVVRVSIDAKGKAVGKPVMLLEDFVRDDKALGRPTMVAFAQDGALLISDDVGGIIWRVTGKAASVQRAQGAQVAAR